MENKLSEGWTLKKMLDVVDYEGGSQPPKKYFIYQPKKGYVRLLQIRDFGKNPFPTYVPNSKRLKKVNEDDILIARYGGSTSEKDSLGRVCTGLSGAYNVALAKLIFSDKELDRRYVKYLFMGPWFRDVVSKNSRSCQKGFNREELNGIVFPIAPLEEQKRISDKLDVLLTKVKNTQSRLDKIPAFLGRFRQSVLSSACSGKLTDDWRGKLNGINSKSNNDESTDLPEIPDTWSWIKLSTTGEMSRGKSRHRPRNEPSLFGGPYPFIQTGDIAQSGGRITSHKQTYNEKGLAQSRLWPKGTICITIAANIAESAILTYPVCFPDSVVGIIVNPKTCIAEYIEYFIRVAKADLAMFAPATAQKNINIGILNEVSVPLPPLPEQREIVQRVESLLKLAEQIETRYTKTKSQVDRIEQSILAKAFRGELVP